MGSTRRADDADAKPRGGRASLAAVILLTLVALALIVSASVVEIIGGGSATVGSRPDHDAWIPRETAIGFCVAEAAPARSGSEALAAAVESSIALQPHLFPDGSSVHAAITDVGSERIRTVAAWPSLPSPEALAGLESGTDRDVCPVVTDGWAAVITAELLSDGADRILAGADFGDDWTGVATVEFHPEASMVRSHLAFSGPLGISGNCWIDETFSVAAATGTVVITTESDDDAGILGAVACSRFADELPDGAAGAQAMRLIPSSLSGAEAAFATAASSVIVTSAGITVRGGLDG